MRADGSIAGNDNDRRLMFQTIGYRWARNLAAYDAFETNRFVGYYETNAVNSAVVLATAEWHGRRH